MPIIELKCTKCGRESEELVAADGKYPKCPECGGKMQQNYNGALKVNSVKKHNCSGHCASCSGCH